MDCGPPGSSVHGVLQARILEWVPFPSPGEFPNTGIEPGPLALAGRFFNQFFTLTKSLVLVRSGGEILDVGRRRACGPVTSSSVNTQVYL